MGVVRSGAKGTRNTRAERGVGGRKGKIPREGEFTLRTDP